MIFKKIKLGIRPLKVLYNYKKKLHHLHIYKYAPTGKNSSTQEVTCGNLICNNAISGDDLFNIEIKTDIEIVNLNQE
jgi:hypothetical protein